jgi:hypothetical protein
MRLRKFFTGVGLVLASGYFVYSIIQEQNREYVSASVSEVCSNGESGYYELVGVPGSVSLDLSNDGSRLAIVLGCDDGVISAYSSESPGLRKRYFEAEALIKYYIDRDDTTRIKLKGELESDGTFKFKLPRNLDSLIE